MNPKISVCIIAKNEDKYIEDCIKSVLPISNEIIVLDTGSTDKTIEISSKYAKVYQSVWKDDFSKARNECISYAKGDWIINLSADERLTKECTNNLLKYLKSLDHIHSPIILYLKVLEQSNDNRFINSYLKDYIFNKGYGTKYIRQIHEYLVTNDEANTIRQTNTFLTIFHIGETRSQKELYDKKENYIKKINNLIGANPDKLDNYYYYRHLGDEYFETEQHDKSLEAYLLSYKLMIKIGFEKENIFYQSVVSRIVKELIFFQKDYQQALNYISEQFNLNPESPELLFYLGFCKNRLGENNLGLNFHKKALSLLDYNEINKPLIANLCVEIGRFSIIYDYEYGINYLLKAHNIFPESEPIIEHVIKYYLLRDDFLNALKFYNLISENNNFISNYNLSCEIFRYLEKQSHWEEQEISSIRNKIKTSI